MTRISPRARDNAPMIRSVPHGSTEGVPGATATGLSGVLTLDRLAGAPALCSAVIEGVDGESSLHRRLLEAGFTAGSPVRFVMATPFGDPLVFSLRGASIALRKSEARCVRVRIA